MNNVMIRQYTGVIHTHCNVAKCRGWMRFFLCHLTATNRHKMIEFEGDQNTMAKDNNSERLLRRVTKYNNREMRQAILPYLNTFR